MPDVNQPTIKIEFSPTTAPLDAPVYSADISGYFLDEGFSIRRGRTDKTTPITAGRATLTLLNTDRRFDPEYTSGTYYPNIKPMKRLRITFRWSATDYAQFTGYVEGWVPDYDMNGRSVCRVTVVDAFGSFFARQNVGGEVLMSTLPSVATTWQYVGAGNTAFVNTVDLVDIYMPRPGNRKINFSFPGTVNTAAGLQIFIEGTTTAGSTFTESFTIANGVTNGSAQTVRNYTTILRFSVAPITAGGSFHASDIGQPFYVTIDGVFPSESSGDAMTTLLNATRWRSADSSIETGVSLLQSYTVTGGPLLNYAQTITDSEGGVMFMSKEGVFTFYNRHHQILATSTATFGDAGAELPYSRLEYDYGEGAIYNQVRAQRVGGIEQVSQDETSADAYFVRTYPGRGQTIQADENEVLAQTQFLLARYKDPHTVVKVLEHCGEKSPSTLWPVILAGDLQKLYTVVRRPPVGTAITQICVVEGIDITMNAQHELRFVWTFSDAIANAGVTFLILDDPIYGRLDYNALAY